MADKLVIKKDTLTSIADAIREQEGSEASILVSDFAQRILDIEGGGFLDFEMTDFDFSESESNTIEYPCSIENPYFIILVSKYVNGADITPIALGDNKRRVLLAYQSDLGTSGGKGTIRYTHPSTAGSAASVSNYSLYDLSTNTVKFTSSGYFFVTKYNLFILGASIIPED